MIPARGPQTLNIYTICVSLRAGNRPWVRCGVDVVDVDVEDVDVDVDVLFADDHYVCSSVAGLLCSTPKACYPQASVTGLLCS